VSTDPPPGLKKKPSMAMPFPQKDFDLLFREFDTDGNGSVDFRGQGAAWDWESTVVRN